MFPPNLGFNLFVNLFSFNQDWFYISVCIWLIVGLIYLRVGMVKNCHNGRPLKVNGRDYFTVAYIKKDMSKVPQLILSPLTYLLECWGSFNETWPEHKVTSVYVMTSWSTAAAAGRAKLTTR